MEQDGKHEKRDLGYSVKDAKDAVEEKKPHYCVIFTQDLKQWNVTETIRRALPEGKGEVFYPCREIWWKGLNKIVCRPLFPGYVFIRSEMKKTELHDYIKRSRSQMFSFIKELKLSEKRVSGEDLFDDGSDIIDLSDEEAEFFDMMLGFKFDAELDERIEKAAEDGKPYLPAQTFDKNGEIVKDNSPYANFSEEKKAAEAEKRRIRKKVPERGVAQMSFGYMEGKKHIIMDGPLLGAEHWIDRIDVRENTAYMWAKVNGKPTKMGLKILGKKLWYPKDEGGPDVLADGTIVDCDALAKAMNSGSLRNEGKPESPKNQKWQKYTKNQQRKR